MPQDHSTKHNKSLLITGASDGIGKALAFVMAKRGYDLALTARRLDELNEIKAQIKADCPNVKVEVARHDVTDLSQTETVFQTLRSSLGSLDLIMLNAGISCRDRLGESQLEHQTRVIDVNVNGALAGVDAALKIFRDQGHGHLIGTSSVAAYRGLPRGASYCASKAALTTLLEAVRAETREENIDITVLHPGYIDTNINRALKSRPFVIDVDTGAEIIAKLIEKRVKRSTVPVWPWNIIAPVLRHLPDAVVAKM